MSNTFVTPKVVSTIQQSRINYNTSLTSILSNFASAGEPAAGNITLEGASSLQTGMLWYKAGTDTSDGQGRMLVYNGSEFTRDGLSTYAMPSIAAANAAVVAGTIESGELVTVGTDRLYMVNQASTGIFDVGASATTLSGLVATQFLRSDIDSNAQGNVQVAGTVTATDFDSLSDARLKTDVELVEDALDKIDYISGVTFNFKDTQKRSAGVLAQDVERVLPEAVTMDTNGVKSVSYSAVLALVIQAFKTYVNKTDAEIEKLKNG